MEELLNKLIEKGWIPFGIYGNWDLEWERICIEEQDEYTNEYRLKVYWINVDYVEFNWLCDEDKHFSDRFSLREIVSKWSWLWQFCIANHLLKKYSDLWDDWEYIIGRWQDWKDCKTEDWEYIDDNRDSDIYHQDDSYQYRLIESSLKDESELEEFLPQNIKING